MSAAPDFVVRSLFPDRTSVAIREADDNRRAALAFLTEWTQQRWPHLEPRIFSQFDGSFGVWGFVAKEGWTHNTDIPHGMRYDKKDKALVPAKRTDEGKALAKEIGSLGFRYPHIDGLGGIICIKDSEKHYFAGWHYFVFDRANGGTDVFAAIGRPELDEPRAQKVIDEDGTWEVVPLSAFHVAQEEHEAAMAS